MNVKLYNTPSGTFDFNNPSTLLDQKNLTGITASAFTFNWANVSTTLRAAGVTNTFITIVFDLTASGYGSIDNIIINANNVLPVDLISFTGRTEKNKVLLNWKPENKINASHYEIERSTDGIIFKKIDRGNAQGNHVNFYKYIDASPISGVNYYRLKQTDRNNSFKYSYVASILYDGSEEITVYPKPAKDKINVRLPVTRGTWTTTIFLNTGKQIKTTEVSTANPVITVFGLPPGNYILRLKNKSLQKTVNFLKE